MNEFRTGQKNMDPEKREKKQERKNGQKWAKREKET